MNYIENAVALRRELHQIPELGWGEFCTTARIIEELDRLGWKVHAGLEQIGLDDVMGRSPEFVKQNIERAKSEGVSEAMLERMQGFTGCIAEFDTGRPGTVTAYRFDIDCVGVQETDKPEHLPNKAGFASKHPGAMHSCGHDGHTAVGLTLARWIVDNKDSLSGRIKLIFQPAEEGVRGGAAQAASGLLDDVDYLLGAHLAMMCPTGEVTTVPTGVLCTTKLDIRFTGAPAHPTMSPHLGRNALACACTCVTELLGMARHGNGLGCINVGLMSAGECRNVIPVHAQIQMEVRGETAEINDFMVDQAVRIVKGTALAYDVQYEVEKVGEAGEMINDRDSLSLCAKKSINQSTLLIPTQAIRLNPMMPPASLWFAIPQRLLSMCISFVTAMIHFRISPVPFLSNCLLILPDKRLLISEAGALAFRQIPTTTSPLCWKTAKPSA